MFCSSGSLLHLSCTLPLFFSEQLPPSTALFKRNFTEQLHVMSCQRQPAHNILAFKDFLFSPLPFLFRSSARVLKALGGTCFYFLISRKLFVLFVLLPSFPVSRSLRSARGSSGSTFSDHLQRKSFD